jgi:CDP-4-dehydro-6-deoxyglucose reductase
MSRIVPAPKNYRAVLLRSHELAPGTKHLEWEITAGGRFDFLAGQFISMRLYHDGQELTRAYSIASAPDDGRRFDLCLNRVRGGVFSSYLCDLKPGAEMNFHGPHGFFFVQEPLPSNLVFIATGTGIAPIRGILRDLFARGLLASSRVWLLFGVRDPEKILYRTEFEQLAEQHPNFHFVPTLSRPPAGWTGATGYVQEQLRRWFAGQHDFTAYICGLKAMVDDVRAILKNEFGLDRKQIHYEKYD